jgi:hypothetical protein
MLNMILFSRKPAVSIEVMGGAHDSMERRLTFDCRRRLDRRVRGNAR